MITIWHTVGFGIGLAVSALIIGTCEWIASPSNTVSGMGGQVPCNSCSAGEKVDESIMVWKKLFKREE
jgi:hypothetical protein